MAPKKKQTLTQEQKELEAHVKGYQFKELTDKFSEMKDEFGRKLDTIINETKGVVTSDQLDQRLDKFEKDILENVEDKIDKIHLEYRPTKQAAWWALGVIIIALVGQIAYQIYGG